MALLGFVAAPGQLVADGAGEGKAAVTYLLPPALGATALVLPASNYFPYKLPSIVNY